MQRISAFSLAQPIRLCLSAVIALSVCPSFSTAQTNAQNTHEHGAATVNIVQSGTIARAELNITGIDVVGFEHAAHSNEDRQEIGEALRKLGKAEQFLSWPTEFSCVLDTEHAALLGKDHEDEHDDHDHEVTSEDSDDEHQDDEDTHTEFTAIYKWTCPHFNLSGTARLSIFEAFPRLEKLTINFVGESIQAQQIATSRGPEFVLEMLGQ
jgi:hypothetical protein